MSIKILHPKVSSQIAAGEVVERPSSVVKELVENSIDAGASNITVEADAGGIDRIRVIDNGSGILKNEILLAFERFATSKISTAEELETISTLGFRGEALPSIAAVSKTSLVTRTESDNGGTFVEFKGGTHIETRDVPAPSGTIVTVENLFHNLPARRKFLGSTSTESHQIQSIVSRYALAKPEIRINMSINGKLMISSSGSGSLQEAISEIYGSETAVQMLTIPPNSSEISISGMIGPGSLNRSNRNRINLFINGRWVSDRKLNYSIESAYHGFLKERRFPVAVINLQVPYEDVDVNAHPSKTEVRLKHEGQIFGALQKAVRETLISDSPIPHFGSDSIYNVQPHFQIEYTKKHPINETQESQISNQEFTKNTNTNRIQTLMPSKALPALRILGQVHSTYIVSEGPDGIYLVDQHAAHERILFEDIMTKSITDLINSQSLLEPITINLDYRQAEIAQLHQELIRDLGFDYQDFGDNTYILRAVPSALHKDDPDKMFTDFIDLMAEGGGFKTWREKAAYSMACHGAIRAGKIMTQREMTELIQLLESCKQPHTCPHGRPTIVQITRSLLEKEFGRT